MDPKEANELKSIFDIKENWPYGFSFVESIFTEQLYTVDVAPTIVITQPWEKYQPRTTPF